jgi:competence protein ComEA
MKNFFNFNFSHRNGIIYLSLLVMVVFLIVDYNQRPIKEKYDFSIYKEQIKQLQRKKVEKSVFKIKKPKIKKESRFNDNEVVERLLVEINTVDTLGLKELPAIGSVFASRICKFRQILGGFVSINQLLDVYGMDSSRFNTIQSYLTIDISQVKMLNINSLSTSELKKHPYISYKDANAIVNYRHQHGVYETLSDLLKIRLIDSIKLRKIAPYISINDSSSVSQ